MPDTQILQNLTTTAKALVAPGKGILAADESFPTIEKRFKKINLPSTEGSRRLYRQLLFTTPGIEDFLSGIILFDDTIRQKADDGRPFPELLSERGIIPGIKVDEGGELMAGSTIEKIAKGAGGLAVRLPEYKTLGARFTKFRSIYTITDTTPTNEAIAANAEEQAKFARASQAAGLVPIVEPEVLRDGAHALQRCAEVTTQVLQAVFEALRKQNVSFAGMLLKPNMITSGEDAAPDSPEAVAAATLRVLKAVVPQELPGIVFLSGGISAENATLYLNELNKQAATVPWQLSFSHGRALQGPVLETWLGKSENVAAAQKVFYHRAKLNGAARLAKYSPVMESVNKL